MPRGLVVLLAAIALAGCTAGTPEEAGPTDDEPAAREDARVETAPSVTPTIEYTVTAEGRTIAPEPGPAPVTPIAEPAPAPAPAQAPAPPPEAPAPAEPAPAATPAPSTPPPPSPAPAASPAPLPTPAAPTPASPAPPAPAAWPREGSHVSYTTRVGQAFAGSQQSRVVYSNLSWTYTDGDWRGECVAQVHDDMDGDGVVTVTEERRAYTAASPPHWPLLNTRDPPAVGEDVTTWTAEGCTLTSDTWTYAGESDGVHRATSTAEDVPYEFSTTWDADSGVVLRWHWTKAGSSAPRTESGELVATDAP